MEKLISNKQLAQHIYPVLEMLNNEIKRLKMKKIEFEILGEKILKLDTYRRITRLCIHEHNLFQKRLCNAVSMLNMRRYSKMQPQ